MDVPSGEALKTQFTFKCSGWADPDGDLTYEFKYETANGAHVLLYYGKQDYFTGKLPTGGGDQHNLRIKIRVMDPFKAANDTTIDVKVRGSILI